MTPLDLTNIRATARVNIVYLDQNEVETQRDITPILPVRTRKNVLGVYAYCHLRQDYRTFLLENIKDPVRTDRPPHSLHEIFMHLAMLDRGASAFRGIRRHARVGEDWG